MAAYACLDKDLEPDPSKLMMPFVFYIKNCAPFFYRFIDVLTLVFFFFFIRNVAAYACLDKDVEPDPSKLMMPFVFIKKMCSFRS